MPKAIPYRLEHCGGTVTVTPDGIVLDKISGKHGSASIELSGKGDATHGANWDLSIMTRDIPVDAELIKAVPPGVAGMIKQSHLGGKISMNLKTFRYRDEDGTAAAPDIDAAGSLRIEQGSLDLEVPMTDLFGGMTFEAAVRQGQIASVQGQVAIDQLTLAGRPVRNFQARIDKPPDSPSLRIDQIQGELAGGLLDGTMNLAFPDQRPASYSLDVVLKNADVRTVAGQSQDIQGQLSASLALEGEWSDISTRRGRGDVQVSGQKMYQIPLLLGLWEVTNLSLPTQDPFNEGTARYSVEGKRITFEQVQLRSDSLLMDGSGYLDFGTKQVRLNFTTDNPNWPKLPFIHDIWQGAKQELLQIQVRGTVEEPKLSATPLHTFTTTVDQVLGGSDGK